MLYFATLGGYLTLVSPRTLPIALLVTCFLAYPSSSPNETRTNISSKTCQPKDAEIMRHFQNFADNQVPNISNNPSFRLKYLGVPDRSDGSDRTSFRLTENYTLPVAQATGRAA
jgi:hypothetical protein